MNSYFSTFLCTGVLYTMMIKKKRITAALLALGLGAVTMFSQFPVSAAEETAQNTDAAAQTADPSVVVTNGIDGWPQASDISSAAAIVMETSTNTVLYSKNADQPLYPASAVKIMTCLMLSAGGAVSLALLNKYIQFSATSRGLTREENSLCYKWRLGNIYYTKCGSGKPLLLIHDLHFASSGYEWESIREQLSRSYTVYTLDLLGCGRSEKPNLTYTNYLFVQLICDFIKSEIGHRTNILSTGDSAALSIMACSNSPELFDQIMLINPSSLTDCCQLPGKNAKLYKLLLDLPLAGTLIYHIACSRSMIEEAFRTKYFYNPYTVKPVQIDRSHEAAHLGECPKAIFSSIECRYTKCNISNALRKIDNSIFIIGGSEEPMIEATIQDYKIYNSAIESSIIPKTKHLPQLEQPDAVMDAIHMFFS